MVKSLARILWGLQDPRPTHRTQDRDADALHPDNYITSG